MHFHVTLEKGRDLWKRIEGDASNVKGLDSCPSQLELKVEVRRWGLRSLGYTEICPLQWDVPLGSGTHRGAQASLLNSDLCTQLAHQYLMLGRFSDLYLEQSQVHFLLCQTSSTFSLFIIVSA